MSARQDVSLVCQSEKATSIQSIRPPDSLSLSLSLVCTHVGVPISVKIVIDTRTLGGPNPDLNANSQPLPKT